MSRTATAWLSIGLSILVQIAGGGGVVFGQGSAHDRLVPILWNNGKVYFFHGSDYSRYDANNDKADEADGNGNPYPRAIAGSWPGLFSENIDAAVFWPAPPPHTSTPKTVAYFFKGNQFMRYDVTADRADPDDGTGRPYPQPISLKWPGVWPDRVDAILVWPTKRNGRTVAYFFRGSQYLRFDVQNHRTDPGYPKPIAGNWPNFKFPNGVDGAVAWPNKIEGKTVVYFFKGSQYMRYDVDADRADDQSQGGLHYPALVQGNWPGLFIAKGPAGQNPEVEIEINQTAADTDDYVTWAPTFSRIRIKPGTSQGANVTVVLTNDAPAAIPSGGDVLFASSRTPWPINTTATSENVTLTLPANSDWVPFVVAGKFGRPSTNDKDAVMEAHQNTATGPVLGTKALMVRVRKDANTLTPGERDRLLQAMRSLRNGGQYVMFQELHRLSAIAGDESHSQPAFLPWHRAFILQIERALQGIDPSVTLPYWNWDFAAPNVFNADFLGAGRGGASFVDEPVFSATNPLNGWNTDLPFSAGRLSRRTFDQTVAPSASMNPLSFRPLIDPAGTGGGLENSANFGPRFPDTAASNPAFSVRVERESHDLAHSWSCGSGHLVTPVRSAADPLFYLLHAQVDRQWAFWQNRQNRHGVGAGGGTVSFPAPAHYDNAGNWNDAGVTAWQRGSFLEDTMWPWDGTSGPAGASGRDARPVNQGGVPGDTEAPDNLPASRPLVARTPFPPSAIANLWPPAPTAVRVRHVIDYLGKFNPANGLGVSYDDVPY
ncbi:MAG: tyrosinase family protein [Nitrospiraceae bacterium]